MDERAIGGGGTALLRVDAGFSMKGSATPASWRHNALAPAILFHDDVTIRFVGPEEFDHRDLDVVFADYTNAYGAARNIRVVAGHEKHAASAEYANALIRHSFERAERRLRAALERSAQEWREERRTERRLRARRRLREAAGAVVRIFEGALTIGVGLLLGVAVLFALKGE